MFQTKNEKFVKKAEKIANITRIGHDIIIL